MAAGNQHVLQAVEGVFDEIKRHAPNEFFKLNADPKLKDAITDAARAVAAEEVRIAHEFTSQPDQNIRERLAKHLPQARIKLIEEALTIPTFRMELTQRSDGKHWVQLTRKGGEFLPGRALATVADTEWASVLQNASILVEAVFLVMQAVGIEISPVESTINATIEDTVEEIENSAQLQKANAEFISSWQAAGGDALEKAKAIFILIKDSYAAGILWTIIKSLCKEMKWYDWLKTVAMVTAMIIAALATDGVALIAKIALIILSAVDFARKIANLEKLEEIKQTL
ncbi:uncharacterized protein LOC144660133 [Oculina patagonica]